MRISDWSSDVCSSDLLGRLDIDGGLLATLIVFQIIGNALILRQGAQTRLFNGSDVDEGVVAAVLRCDEAVALVRIEEFYFAGRHGLFLWIVCARLFWEAVTIAGLVYEYDRRAVQDRKSTRLNSSH